MLVAPLLPHLKKGSLPTVFGLSGYSGAGTISGGHDPDGRPTTLPKVSPESLAGGVRPYALTDHIHEREAGRHLSRLQSSGSSSDAIKVAFIPAVTPWFSGILSTASIELEQSLSARNVKELFEAQYEGEKLVSIKREVPSLQDVEGKQGWTVGGFQVHSEGKRAVIVGGLDNLLKGAATQCLQVCCASSFGGERISVISSFLM
jgi:N-acetyl-gamma-glutamyl-phosphate reductase / acetylglutamate kinase